MSKRKVQFAADDDDLEEIYQQSAGATDAIGTKAREKPTRFKEKHSLDSDEEDVPEKYDVLNDDDIEGMHNVIHSVILHFIIYIFYYRSLCFETDFGQ